MGGKDDRGRRRRRTGSDLSTDAATRAATGAATTVDDAKAAAAHAVELVKEKLGAATECDGRA
jgi:hypothetical protein